jgi:Zn-dependent protease with chaperone function
MEFFREGWVVIRWLRVELWSFLEKDGWSFNGHSVVIQWSFNGYSMVVLQVVRAFSREFEYYALFYF